MFSHHFEFHQQVVDNAATPAPWKKNIAFIATISLMLTLIGFGSKYLNSFLLTHWLSIEVFGNYSYVTNLIITLSLLALSGKDKVSVKFLPAYLAEQKYGEVRGFYQYFSKYFLFSSLFILLISTALFWLDNYTPLSQYSKDYVLLSYVWIVPFMALFIYTTTLLRSYHWSYLSTSSQVLILPAITTFYIYIIHVFLHPLNLTLALLSFFLATITLIVIHEICLRKSIQWDHLKKYTPVFYASQWNTVGYQLMLSMLILASEQTIVNILLKFFDHNNTNLGLFNAAYTLVAAIWISATACATVLTPGISLAKEKNDLVKLQRINNIGFAIMVIPGIIISISFLLWGKTILNYFGPDYSRAYWTLLLLTAGNFIGVLNGMAVYFLQYASDPKSLMKLTSAFTIMLCIIGAVLCHYLGLEGAALTNALFQVVLGTVFAIQVKRKLNIKPWVIF